MSEGSLRGAASALAARRTAYEIAPRASPDGLARAGAATQRKRVPETRRRTRTANRASVMSSSSNARITRCASVSSSATQRRRARWSSRSRSTVILTRFGPRGGRSSSIAFGSFSRRPAPAAAERSWARRSLAEPGLTWRVARPGVRPEGLRTPRRCAGPRKRGRSTPGGGSRRRGPAYRSPQGPRASRGRSGCRVERA